MRHIELLTMESYLETKKELIENANYMIEELNIDHTTRLFEIIEEIKEEYFGRRKNEQEEPFFICTKKRGADFEVEVTNSIYTSQYEFMIELKEKHKRLISVEREVEISNDIETILNTVFMHSCSRWEGVDERMYEIIKYTLTEERRCDYLDNGKFINEMTEKDIYPFEQQNGSLPLYCQEMQRVLFGVHRKIFELSKSLDITRFSFHEIKKIVEEVTKGIKHNESQEYTENSEYSSGDYIENSEDYILLDRILGISLTNIIYWKTKEIKERKLQDRIIEIVGYLVKCQYSIGRNSVAQLLFDYLGIMEYDETIIQTVENILAKKIKVWNEYFEEVEAVILVPIFMYLKKCAVKDQIELCKYIESENLWNEYIYMDEIANSEGMKNMENLKGNLNTNKIRIPKGNMNYRTWYAYIHKLVFESIWKEYYI